MASTVIQRLQDPGRAVAIATASGLSEPVISRLKNDHLDNMCKLLAFAGLKIVPADVKCFRSDDVDALLVLARRQLNDAQDSGSLVWE